MNNYVDPGNSSELNYSPPPTSELRPITAASGSLALTCAVLWGGLAVAIRFTQDDLPPIGTAALRFLIASGIVYLWARWQWQPLAVRPGQWRPIIVLGLLLFVQISSFHWGLTRTNSAHGSVLIGSHPVFVALLAHFAMRGDRLSRKKVAGLAVAVAGLVMLVAGSGSSLDVAGDPATLTGDLVILGSSFLLGAKTVYTKHALATTEVAKLLLWSHLLGTALFFVYSIAGEGIHQFHFSQRAAWGLAYQGAVVAGFCFLAWTALLRRHRASQLAVFTFAQPLCGLLFGVALRGDAFTPWLAIGGLAVAAGIYLVTRAGD